MGQMFFFFPFIVFYLRNSSVNSCFGKCIKGTEHIIYRSVNGKNQQAHEVPALNTQKTTTTIISDNASTSSSFLELRSNSLQEAEIRKQEPATSTKNIQKQSPKKRSLKSLKNYSAKIPSLFKSKYIGLALTTYLVYLAFNCVMLATTKIEFPLLQLLPEQSHLRKHMHAHQTHFDLGPIVIVTFKQPFDVYNNMLKLRYFIKDAKQLEAMHPTFEMNWQVNAFNNPLIPCETVLESEACFCESAYEASRVQYHQNDVRLGNRSVSGDRECVVNSNRFYLQLAHFNGTQKELNSYNELFNLARLKYDWNETLLSVFTVVGPIFEQMNELYVELAMLLIFNIEAVFLVSFFSLFDLRTVCIHTLIHVSTYISVISISNLFRINLNFMYLLNFLMVPAMVNEFLGYLSHIYVFKLKAGLRLKAVAGVYRSYLNKINLFILLSFISLLAMNSCKLYNFKILFHVLCNLFINLYLNVYIFYPLLLALFGRRSVAIERAAPAINDQKEFQPILNDKITK